MDNLPAKQETNIMELLSAAVHQIQQVGADGATAMVGVIERLASLKREEDANNARVAFFRALTAFQNECPEIPKDKHNRSMSSRGVEISLDWASLYSIRKTIKPLMIKHGFSYRWSGESKVEAGKEIRTETCYLQHDLGHTEFASMSAEVPDKIMQLNSAQRSIATQSYLKRYTLLAVLGLVIEDEDNMEEADPTTVDKSTAELIRRKIKDSGADEGRFLKFMGVERIEDIRRVDLGKANIALDVKTSSKSSKPDSETIDAKKVAADYKELYELLGKIEKRRDELQIGSDWIAKQRQRLSQPMEIDEIEKIRIEYSDYLGV